MQKGLSMTTSTDTDRLGRIIPILDDELEDFRTEAAAFRAGQREEIAFIGFRLKQGVYGQRQTDVHMTRVKLPVGGVSSAQMDAFGDVAERWAPLKKGHITTRQNIQFHFIPLDQMPDVLRHLGDVGLSSREACGNTVRNVTGDPWMGVCDDEVFDPTPYAGAFVRYWVRHPVSQLLPRKFKAYFTGSPHDEAMCGIHDLGFMARIREIDGKPVRGFKVVAGGGLSTAAKRAAVLTEFVAVDDFLQLSEAVLRIFNNADELRRNILKARLKFLVHRVGEAAFQEMVAEELRNPWAQSPIALDDYRVDADEAGAAPAPRADAPRPSAADTVDAAAFEQWKAKAVRTQRQAGYSTVEVMAPQGDLDPDQWRGLAQIMRDYAGPLARTTPWQNFLLRWVPETHLYAIWQGLQRIGLGSDDAGEITDVVSCPGTDSCKLGITSSMGLNRAVQERLRAMAIDDPLTRQMRVHISGCPNSCGQHHIASIGFHGAAIKSGRRQVPAYHVFLAGRMRGDELRFGTLLKLRVPAKRVPDLTERFIRFYQRERTAGEDFNAFADRMGADPFEEIGQDLTLPPAFSPETVPMFIDWDRQDIYILQRGEGECAV